MNGQRCALEHFRSVMPRGNRNWSASTEDSPGGPVFGIHTVSSCTTSVVSAKMADEWPLYAGCRSTEHAQTA